MKIKIIGMLVLIISCHQTTVEYTEITDENKFEVMKETGVTEWELNQDR